MRRLTNLVSVLDPIADAFAGTVNTDIVSMRNYKTAEFIIFKGVGAVGTSTVTIDACDDVSASTTSAVAFLYQISTTKDTWGAVTKATSAGFTTTAGSAQIYRVWVDASVLGEVGYEFVRMTLTEVANAAVLAGVMVQLHEPKIEQDTPPTAIA